MNFKKAEQLIEHTLESAVEKDNNALELSRAYGMCESLITLNDGDSILTQDEIEHIAHLKRRALNIMLISLLHDLENLKE